MKKLLSIVFLFVSILANCQQISELNKGLVFHWKGDEWSGNRDAVSNIQGNATNTYNVLGRGGEGRRSVEYNGSSSYTALPNSIPAFGTGDFTVITRIYVTAASVNPILSGTSGGTFAYYIYSDGTIYLVDGTNAVGSTTKFSQYGQWVTIVYSRSGSNGTFYVDGTSFGTSSDTYNWSVAATALGKYSTFYLNGSISLVRIFNYALTDLQIAKYSRPEYPIEWVDRGTTGTNLVTNGDFSSGSAGWTVATYWDISNQKANYSPGGGYNSFVSRSISTISSKKYKFNFTISNISTTALTFIFIGNNTIIPSWGSLSNGIYTYGFTASESNQDLYVYGNIYNSSYSIDDISITQLGCVLDLNAEGLSKSDETIWVDRTNSTAGSTDVYASNTNTSLVVPPASCLGVTAFNGVSSKIKLLNTPSNPILGASDRTYACWVLLVDVGTYKQFIGVGPNTNYNGFYFGVNLTNKISVGNVAVNASAQSMTALSINTWYHVAFTFSGGNIIYYLNGVLDGTATIADTNTTAGNTYIGVYLSEAGSFMSGFISDAVIYNKKLDAEQIKLLYDLGH